MSATLEDQAEIEVFEGLETTSATLLFGSHRNLPAAAAERVFGDADQGTRRYREARVLRLYGQTWTVRVSTLAAFERRSSRLQAWLLLAGGVLLSAAGAASAWVLVNARARAVLLAERMTASLRRSETESRRLALVASRTASAVMLTDADWRIDWVNESFTRIYGYTSAEVKDRQPGTFLRSPGTDAETVAEMTAADVAGTAFKGDLLNRTKDGREIWVQIETQPLRDAEERITGHMVLVLDITARKAAEAELALKEARFRLIFEGRASEFPCGATGPAPPNC